MDNIDACQRTIGYHTTYHPMERKFLTVKRKKDEGKIISMGLGCEMGLPTHYSPRIPWLLEQRYKSPGLQDSWPFLFFLFLKQEYVCRTIC